MEKNRLKVRLDSLTHNLVRYQVVEKTEQYTSVDEFTNTAIRNSLPHLRELVSGGRQLRDLVRLFGGIKEVNETVPEIQDESSLKNENVSDGLVVSVQVKIKTHNQLTTIRDETGMDVSKVIRYCIFRQLYEGYVRPVDETDVLLDDGLLEPWQHRALSRKWPVLQNGLVLPKTRLHEIIYRRFSLQYDETKSLVEQDMDSFRDFAEEYLNNFKDSPCHEEIVDMFGEEAFTDLERLIEEELPDLV